jgi:hypothetical protein
MAGTVTNLPSDSRTLGQPLQLAGKTRNLSTGGCIVSGVVVAGDNAMKKYGL